MIPFELRDFLRCNGYLNSYLTLGPAKLPSLSSQEPPNCLWATWKRRLSNTSGLFGGQIIYLRITHRMTYAERKKH
jgi:hypothetical protein